MKTSSTPAMAAAAVALVLTSSCAVSSKLNSIKSAGMTSRLALPSEREVERYGGKAREEKADSDGLFAMRVRKDESTGETMASDDLDPAVIVARFRNTAERAGMVQFDFMIVATDSIRDPSWQLRFYPVVYYDGGDSLALSPLYLSGADFRASQDRAYRRYEDYLRSLSRDSTLFVDCRQSAAFAQRYPDAQVSYDELKSHFSRPLIIRWNASRASRKDEVRDRLISVPRPDDNAVREDSTDFYGGDFVYFYRQSIPAGRNLRKFDLRVSTDIYNARGLVYSMGATQPITYYVSSLSSLVDESYTSHADTLYQKGLQMLRDRDWEGAIQILAPYEDYHSALAYLALEYNATASAILEALPCSASRDYLLAICYSRRGMEMQSVEMLKSAVLQDSTYKYRGNLDPEIASIVKKYKLFEEDYSCESFL